MTMQKVKKKQNKNNLRINFNCNHNSSYSKCTRAKRKWNRLLLWSKNNACNRCYRHKSKMRPAWKSIQIISRSNFNNKWFLLRECLQNNSTSNSISANNRLQNNGRAKSANRPHNSSNKRPACNQTWFCFVLPCGLHKNIKMWRCGMH